MSAGTLIQKYSEPVTITRYAGGNYVNGTYVEGATSTIDARMSIQPIEGKELLEAPQAQRTRNLKKGYTATEVFTAEISPSEKADLITDEDGVTYEVIKVEAWKGGIISIAPYWKVLLAEVNE